MCRKLSLMFVVAVLVASICFADVAQGVVQGRTLRKTKMQEQAGTGDFVFSELSANTILHVECRLESSVIEMDPWWLKVVAVPSGAGYVADFDVQCVNASPAGHCDNVPHC